MNNLINFYKNLLLEKRGAIKTIGKWFGISFVAGAVFFYFDQTLLEDIAKFFEDKFGVEPALDFNLVLNIFLQNLWVSAVAVFGGVAFGIAPFLIGCVNGFILGYILHALLASPGSNFAENMAFILAGLLPHAIFELPAFIIAAAVGLGIGVRWLNKAAAGQRLRVLGRELKDGLVIFPLIGVVLFVAALIEVYVSGNLIK